MTNKKDKNITTSDNDFKKLVEKNTIKVPQVGDTIVGEVLSASKAEVRLDIDGVLTGVVRSRELYQEADEYANLKPGDSVEATVIEEENENNELELSFRFAGQEKAWSGLREAYANKSIIKVKITDANKGGLLAQYCQIDGFLPVSQLAPENYPRVNGGDRSKILDRLRSFVGKEFEVKVITIDDRDEKIIFSEKEAWNELQQDIISKYKVGTIIEGKITAITDFGVFVSFGENLEGLVHISELAWQRIDDPADLFKVGDTIKAEVISLDGSKIFLSAKKLLQDPWHDVEKKYKAGQIVKGTILKINPFGLFVRLDKEIHGLAHISQLNLAPGQRINEVFKINKEQDFEVVSIEPKEHRLGLAAVRTKSSRDDKKLPAKAEEKAKPKQKRVASDSPAKAKKKDDPTKEKAKAKPVKKKEPAKKKESKVAKKTTKTTAAKKETAAKKKKTTTKKE